MNHDKKDQTSKESKVSAHPDPVDPKKEGKETKKAPSTQHPDPNTTNKKS